jgi:hypothetical protein
MPCAVGHGTIRLRYRSAPTGLTVAWRRPDNIMVIDGERPSRLPVEFPGLTVPPAARGTVQRLPHSLRFELSTDKMVRRFLIDG